MTGKVDDVEKPLRIAADGVDLVEVEPERFEELRSGGTAGFTWLGGVPGDGTRVAAGQGAKSLSDGSHVRPWALFVLVRPDDGLAVGGIGFHSAPRDGSVEIGYDLVEAARGKGYATRALRALTAWAQGHDEVSVVVCTTDIDNVPSRRVMERAGYRHVGTESGLLRYEI